MMHPTKRKIYENRRGHSINSVDQLKMSIIKNINLLIKNSGDDLMDQFIATPTDQPIIIDLKPDEMRMIFQKHDDLILCEFQKYQAKYSAIGDEMGEWKSLLSLTLAQLRFVLLDGKSRMRKVFSEDQFINKDPKLRLDHSSETFTSEMIYSDAL